MRKFVSFLSFLFSILFSSLTSLLTSQFSSSVDLLAHVTSRPIIIHKHRQHTTHQTPSDSRIDLPENDRLAIDFEHFPFLLPNHSSVSTRHNESDYRLHIHTPDRLCIRTLPRQHPCLPNNDSQDHDTTNVHHSPPSPQQTQGNRREIYAH